MNSQEKLACQLFCTAIGIRSCYHLLSEQLLSFSAQPAPGDPGVTTRMEVGPATETFVLELRCLEDGGPGPNALSGECWRQRPLAGIF